MPDDPAPPRPALPRGTLFRVFAPVGTIALLLAVLVVTPEGGPLGGAYGFWLLLLGAMFAGYALAWLRRLPPPKGALDRVVALLPVVLFVLLAVLRVLQPGPRDG